MNIITVTPENCDNIIAELGNNFTIEHYLAERSPTGTFEVTIFCAGISTVFTGVNNFSNNFMNKVFKKRDEVQ